MRASTKIPLTATARVTVEKGALVWTWNQFHTPLEHYQSDEFTAPLEVIGSPHVEFTLNAERKRLCHEGRRADERRVPAKVNLGRGSGRY